MLVIQRGTESGFLLYRYTEDGRFAGDTWHMTLDDAKDQAAFEFDVSTSSWRHVPEPVADPIAFGLQGREAN